MVASLVRHLWTSRDQAQLYELNHVLDSFLELEPENPALLDSLVEFNLAHL